MRIINFDTTAEKALYRGAGWALAVVENDNITKLHMLLSPAEGLTESDGSIESEGTELLKHAGHFIQENNGQNVFMGMVSSYEFVDPTPVDLKDLARIGSFIGDELVKLEHS